MGGAEGCLVIPIRKVLMSLANSCHTTKERLEHTRGHAAEIHVSVYRNHVSPDYISVTSLFFFGFALQHVALMETQQTRF